MPAYRIFVLLALLGGVMASSALAASRAMSAREYFGILPVTIFENTPEGMSEQEKRQLLEQGRTEFWQMHTEGPDGLDMISLPFGESMVSLRVFRGEGQGAAHTAPRGTLIAVGTTGTPMCTLELWREDAAGRVVPVDTPEEPTARDFFAPGSGMPRDVQLSVFFCVTDRGLEAQPVFWNATGMAHVPVNFRVLYVWADGQFKKKALPAGE